MTAHILTAAGLAAVLLTGCAADPPPPTHDAPAIRRIQLRQLPQAPPHDDLRPVEAAGRPDVADPQQVATALLVAGITAQGLDVVDIGAATIRTTPDRRTLRIAVTHQSGRSAPHTSVYDVELQRAADGTWAVVSSTAVQ